MNFATDIRKPLIDAIAPIIVGYSVPAENQTFTPPTNQNWIAIKFDYGDSLVFTLGDDGQDERDGFMQVDFNWLPGKLDGEMHGLIEQIDAVFKIGATFISAGGVVTRIAGKRLSGGFRGGNYFVTPLRIFFTTHSNR